METNVDHLLRMAKRDIKHGSHGFINHSQYSKDLVQLDRPRMAEISPLLDSRRRTRHPIPIFRILLVLGTVFVCCYLIPDDGSRELRVITQEGEETVREITTADNIKWKRCEQDDTMFCTTFTYVLVVSSVSLFAFRALLIHDE
jgi:hypothetical protein